MTYFSFIVACYNSGKFVRDCLESLVMQKYQNSHFEIICVDDGSTDCSSKVIQEYANRISNFKAIRTENSGLEKSVNRGIRLARHNRVVRVDADDVLPLDFLTTMNDAIVSRPGFDFYYPKCYMELYDDGRTVLKSLPIFDPEEIFQRGDFFSTATVYDKNDLEAIGLYPEKIKNCGLENYSVILDLLACNKKGLAVEGASFFYRRHDANMSLVKRRAIVNFGHELLSRHGRKFLTNEFHPYNLVIPRAETGIIVQARMGSSRLEGKVLKTVNGKPLLGYELERLGRAQRADAVLVATTTSQRDDLIVDFCREQGVRFFRGSEEDVLSRYYNAAKDSGFHTVVRVTADCPLIDPEVVDKVLGHFINNRSVVDYVSNTLTRSYPRGMDVEVFTFEALETSHREASAKPDREHVTPYIYKHPERFRILEVTSQEARGDLRWTVDTPEDFELIRRILEALYPIKPNFTMRDCLELLDKNPQWLGINCHIRQKAYGE